ncbi:MAG: hypothetical protein WC987_06165 [Mariniphaga sp.]|jgi:hypothetical protein
MSNKRIFYLTFCFFILLLTQANAQSYRLNKKIFDHRDYVRQDGDRYSPALAGITSFVLPGLGQAISGEPMRGLLFFGGELVAISAMGLGVFLVFAGNISNVQDGTLLGVLLFYGGIFSFIAIDIWSVFDAVKVAKVNNMYHQKRNLGLKLSPFLSNQSYLAHAKPAAGLTLKITF